MEKSETVIVIGLGYGYVSVSVLGFGLVFKRKPTFERQIRYATSTESFSNEILITT